MKNLNQLLQSLQDEWIQLVADPFVRQGQNESFSKPFRLGISDKLSRDRKLVMLVGQEASDFWSYEDDEHAPASIQQWCIDYFDKQLFRFPSSSNERYNRSPFWAFFRYLYRRGVNVCWNNVDKLHRYESISMCNGTVRRTVPLRLEHQLVLSQQYGPDNISLLQREIAAVKPDAIVFLVGPYYSSSIGCAFGLVPNELNAMAPTKETFVTRVEKPLGLSVPVFWTYHPNYLHFNAGYTSQVVDQIITSLS